MTTTITGCTNLSVCKFERQPRIPDRAEDEGKRRDTERVEMPQTDREHYTDSTRNRLVTSAPRTFGTHHILRSAAGRRKNKVTVTAKIALQN